MLPLFSNWCIQPPNERGRNKEARADAQIHIKRERREGNTSSTAADGRRRRGVVFSSPQQPHPALELAAVKTLLSTFLYSLWLGLAGRLTDWMRLYRFWPALGITPFLAHPLSIVWSTAGLAMIYRHLNWPGWPFNPLHQSTRARGAL